MYPNLADKNIDEYLVSVPGIQKCSVCGIIMSANTEFCINCCIPLRAIQEKKRVKIIETLDEAARAIPPEERFWAKERRALEKLQKEKEERGPIPEPSKLKIAAYIDALEELESAVTEDPRYQSKPSALLKCEAIRFSIALINWVYDVGYHLDKLNEFSETLSKEVQDK